MYVTVRATDVSFLNGIKPSLPDFLQKEIAGPVGVAMAIGFIGLLLAGVIIAVSVAYNRRNGDAASAGADISWWIFGLVLLSVLIPFITWVAN